MYNDEELRQLLKMQIPEQKDYENYNPSEQLNTGLLTPPTEIQPTSNNEGAATVTQSAAAANEAMAQQALAGQQATSQQSMANQAQASNSAM